MAERLRSKGIEPTVEGLRRYLNEIHPNDKQREYAAQLIQRLGDPDYNIREEATQSLFRMPSLPVELLTAARNAADPEIAWRAEALLNLGELEFGLTLTTAMRFIEEAQLPGLTKEILAAIPLCHRSNELYAARGALLATYLDAAEPDLLAATKDPDLNVRTTATYVLANASRDRHEAILQQIMSTPTEDALVRIEAAEGLANLGVRDVLPALIEFLQDEDVKVRVRSSVILRQLTGETLQYAAYDRDDRRGEAVARWKEWLANNGATAELTYPLNLAQGRKSYLHGNTLLAMGYNNRVVELDPSGEEVYSINAPGCWMAERMATGNTLVAAYSANKVMEFNPEGDVVWEVDAPSVLSARPLENGNILVSQHSQRTIKEYNRDKEVVWSYQAASSCCDAIRLENGNTLVAQGNDVEEVNPDGEVVWKYTANQIYGISEVDNGNLLIAQLNGKVIEITRDKKEVIWEYDCPNPVDAIRLPNGNTLITSNNEFLEVSPTKEVVWRKQGCNYGSARR